MAGRCRPPSGCGALSHLPYRSNLLHLSQELATPGAFARNPSRVWEFYHYRREVMLSKHPNPAHIAIAECEKRLSKQGRSVVVITQNIDELHRKAGSKHLLEIHGKDQLTWLPQDGKTLGRRSGMTAGRNETCLNCMLVVIGLFVVSPCSLLEVVLGSSYPPLFVTGLFNGF